MFHRLDEYCLFSILSYLPRAQDAMHLGSTNKYLHIITISCTELWGRFLAAIPYIPLQPSLNYKDELISKYDLFVAIHHEIRAVRDDLHSNYRHPSLPEIFAEIFLKLTYPAVVAAKLPRFRFLPKNLLLRLMSFAFTELQLDAWRRLHHK